MGIIGVSDYAQLLGVSKQYTQMCVCVRECIYVPVYLYTYVETSGGYQVPSHDAPYLISGPSTEPSIH